MQNVLDNTMTPRTPNIKDRDSLDSLDPKKYPEKRLSNQGRQIDTLESIYLKKINLYRTSRTKPTPEVQIQQEKYTAGSELCRILSHLYELNNLKSKEDHSLTKQKHMILNALSCLICISQEAKHYGLENGLLTLIMKQVKDLHVELSLAPVDSLIKASDKKRICPLLKHLSMLVGVLTNFMVGDVKVKECAVSLGLADMCHKMWAWCGLQKTLMVDVLRMLCTFTTNCTLGNF